MNFSSPGRGGAAGRRAILLHLYARHALPRGSSARSLPLTSVGKCGSICCHWSSLSQS